MKSSKRIAVMLIAILLLAPLAGLGAQEAQPGLPAEDRPSRAFRTGGWILVGTGALFGVLGGLLLVEGFTSDEQDTADFGKMMGIGTLVAGALSAGVGIFLVKVPLR
ncbi:MAG: hypothetical protein A3J97_04270 [Spirochaetes bacterium RIFOXYC1_FULL_54_7]|nr:MAG: hypothetical protein A3J97_04270 [Spirochaetes bacterium RIFOXYC1_FULL_54_7]